MNKRGKLITIGLLILLGLSTGCEKERTMKLRSDKEPVFELGDAITKSKVMDLIQSGTRPDALKVEIDGCNLDEDEGAYDVGNYTMKVSAAGYKTLKRKIKVEDTKGPELTQLKFDTGLNSNDDLKTYFEVEDKSGDCTIEIDSSKLDLTKAGTYSVNVKAKDKYGNKTTRSFSITVHDYDAEKAQQEAAEKAKQEAEAKAQQEAIEKAKRDEQELTDSEKSKAEDKAAIFIMEQYGAKAGFSTQYYTTKTDEFIEVIMAGVKDEYKDKHQFIVRMRTLPNHEVGDVYEVICDGQQIK